MVASVANGFRQIVWDDQNFTCNGQPYAFHPMYDTAAAPEPNGQPTAWAAWSAHTGNISFSSEIGHFEAPDSDKDDAGCFAGPPPGCLGTDKDFDGYGYHLNPPGWPDGSSRTPTAFAYTAPRSMDANGDYTNTYDGVPVRDRPAGHRGRRGELQHLHRRRVPLPAAAPPVLPVVPQAAERGRATAAAGGSATTCRASSTATAA